MMDYIVVHISSLKSRWWFVYFTLLSIELGIKLLKVFETLDESLRRY